jgi:DNA polymerase-3 subunit delta'
MTAVPSPRETPDLVGHADAERLFLESWSTGKVAHAWMLTGPRGIGKATLAYRIARFVLAGEASADMFDSAPSLAMSTDHPVFRRVASAGHADLKSVERGWSDERKSRRRTEIVIDDVRGVGAFLALTPAEGGWRVVVVDAADEMNTNAANAILKILEEPPKNSLILLISHSPGRLLPTIRSRCRRLPLRPLAEQTVIDLLGRFHPDLNQGDVAILARLAEGSIGRALALAGDGGLDLYRQLIALLETLPRLDVPAAHAYADRIARADSEAVWHTATELLDGWLARLIRAGGRNDDPRTHEIMAGEGRAMMSLLSVAGPDHWLELREKAAALFARTDSVHLDRKQAFLSAMLAVERLAKS